MLQLESLYDLRIHPEVINHDKSIISNLVLIAAVVHRALLDGVGVKYLKKYENNKGKKKSYMVYNSNRLDARIWFTDEQSTLKYFCEMIGWHTPSVRKMALEVFDE